MSERRREPFLVGLTGSIGMGKTETAKLFARLGLPVFDADAVVHALYDPGGAGVGPVAKAFPEAVTGDRVDRERLSEIVRRSPAAFEKLEAIIHPLVRAAEKQFIDAARTRGDELAILDVPLLFETGKSQTMDAIVVVSAPEQVQRQRVLQRPGMTAQKFETIGARQVPDAEKRAKADFVIETDKGLDHAFEQVKRVAGELRRRALAKRKD